MKKIFQFLIFLLAGLAVFLVIIFKLGWQTVLESLKFFFSSSGLLLIGLTGLSFLAGIFRWKIIFQSQGQGFSFLEISRFWLAGFSVAYFTPFALFGGEVSRVYFVRKKLPRVDLADNMAAVGCDKLLDATLFFLFLILGIVRFAFAATLPHNWWFYGAIAVAAGMFSFLTLFYIKRLRKESAVEYILKKIGIKKERLGEDFHFAILEAEKRVFQFFTWKNPVLWQGVGLSFLKYLAFFGQALFFVFLISQTWDFSKAIAISGFLNLASLAPVPASLGALEVLLGFAFLSLGFEFSSGVIFAMVWRGTDIIFYIPGLFLAIKMFLEILGQKIADFFKQ